jgi:hypothetical protein
MNGSDLSQVARQRAIARMFGGDGASGEEGGGGGAPPMDAAPQPAPVFAPPPGLSPPGAAFTSASLRLPSASGFAGSAAPNGARVPAAPLAGPPMAQATATGGIPRAQSHAQAASLPRGAYFFAPDNTLRRNV